MASKSANTTFAEIHTADSTDLVLSDPGLPPRQTDGQTFLGMVHNAIGQWTADPCMESYFDRPQIERSLCFFAC